VKGESATLTPFAGPEAGGVGAPSSGEEEKTNTDKKKKK
jgi:hypothetical protein